MTGGWKDQFLGSNSTKSGVKCDLCGIDCYLDCALATENLHNSDDSALSALPMGDSAQHSTGSREENLSSKFLSCWNVVIVLTHAADSKYLRGELGGK